MVNAEWTEKHRKDLLEQLSQWRAKFLEAQTIIFKLEGALELLAIVNQKVSKDEDNKPAGEAEVVKAQPKSESLSKSL